MPEDKFLSMNMNLTLKQFLYALGLIGLMGVSGFTGVKLAVPSDLPNNTTVQSIGEDIVNSLQTAVDHATLERAELRLKYIELSKEQASLKRDLARTDSTMRKGLGALDYGQKMIMSKLNEYDN